jgi:hypothetical protein
VHLDHRTDFASDRFQVPQERIIGFHPGSSANRTLLSEDELNIVLIKPQPRHALNVDEILPGAHSAEAGVARRAKRLVIAFAFAVEFSFRVFSPKIACQAPKPPKPHKAKGIEWEG